MEKIFRLLIGLFITSTLIITGCKKDSSDPLDKLVGTYNYTMTAPGIITKTGTLIITKKSSNKISILLSDGLLPIPYTVDGNIVIEDAGQFALIPEDGGVVRFTENSTGKLVGNVLTINGICTNPSYATRTFQIVATKN